MSTGPCGRAKPRTPFQRCHTSAERTSAGARAARVGVVDREALLLDGVGEVDRGALEVGDAHPVHDHLDAAEVDERVAVQETLVEVELVDEARTTPGLHGDAKTQVVAALLLQKATNLVRGEVGE